jgi:hypothetical protein
VKYCHPLCSSFKFSSSLIPSFPLERKRHRNISLIPIYFYLP